jgi:hypothetical protein
MPGPLLFLPPRLAASSGRFRFTARLTDAAAARFGIPRSRSDDRAKLLKDWCRALPSAAKGLQSRDQRTGPPQVEQVVEAQC